MAVSIDMGPAFQEGQLFILEADSRRDIGNLFIPAVPDNLMASVTTGLTVNKAIECIQYYDGILMGVSAIFSAIDEMNGVPIKAVFGKKDLPDYEYSDYRNCPQCKAGKKLDALVNTFGYSTIR